MKAARAVGEASREQAERAKMAEKLNRARDLEESALNEYRLAIAAEQQKAAAEKRTERLWAAHAETGRVRQVECLEGHLRRPLALRRGENTRAGTLCKVETSPKTARHSGPRPST